MSFHEIVFWVFAAIAVIPAFLILISKSIVRMAFLLLSSLAGFAGLYLHLEAGFLGFTQVLVYIGGILILFLFGVMLTQRADIPVREKVGPALAVPGFFAGLLLIGALLFLAVGNPWKTHAPVAVQANDNETQQIGVRFLSTYVLPFEAVSILLLAAMVGATYIARARMPGASDEEGAEADVAESKEGGA